MPTILLAQEDAESREMFSALILDFFPTANIQKIAAWPELDAALASPSPVSVLLADILWENEERSAELLLLAERFSKVSFALFGRYDLRGTLPPGYPIPLLNPDEELPLRLAEIMENLSGREFGPYGILGPAGPHDLGRLYWAKHHQLQRPIQLLTPPSGSPVFPKAIRALARVNHPSVYSLYESVPWESRILVALEPVLHPSLLHLRYSGETPHFRACARLATTLGSVLAEMESSSVPARLLGEYDYTLSPKGTVRLRNPAAYPGQPEVSTYDNARRLAELLEPMVRGQPKSDFFLEILRNPGSSAFDLLKKTQDFERQLAEVREVQVRQEELDAARKALRARRVRRWATAIGLILAAGFFAAYAQVIFKNFFLDAPGTLGGETIQIPAGQISRDGKLMNVASFSLDRHEVTIGEYEKFLQALPGLNQAGLLPKAYAKETAKGTILPLERFQPTDWSAILKQARIKGRYPNDLDLGRVTISRDTPVFNVDYVSAYAYAKWKQRRLPSQEEWMLAAAGKEGWKYPWDREAVNSSINLACNADPKKVSQPGYFHVLRAESNPKDVGPYGHHDLGGNLSEWIDSPEANHRLDASARFIGGNYLDEAPVDNFNAVRPAPADQKDLRIGFRTAR